MIGNNFDLYLSFIENQISWHHKVPSKEEFEKANLELERQLKSYE